MTDSEQMKGASPSSSDSQKGSFLKDTPLALKIYGALCIIVGLSSISDVIVALGAVADAFKDGLFAGETVVTQLFVIVLCLAVAASVIIHAFLGIRLLRNMRRRARLTLEVLIVLDIVAGLCIAALVGMEGILFVPIAALVFKVVLLSYVDPALSEERELQRKLRKMEARSDAEDGTLGRDMTGKGYIELDFFNIFWIFVVCCFLGVIIETIYHMTVTEFGVYENRAGLLWGPFSPIYGFGAVLMTVALNRFHDRNFVIIFLVSAVIGGAFEYFVSWFLQYAFGVTAWDYTGTFLNINGRTNFVYMCMWGVLGLFWIKLCLPRMLALVNRIPWQWRYSVTAVATALMVFNGAMTLITLDCWYERLAGVESKSAISEYCAEHYDDEWMENRFQTMDINPENATRSH